MVKATAATQFMRRSRVAIAGGAGRIVVAPAASEWTAITPRLRACREFQVASPPSGSRQLIRLVNGPPPSALCDVQSWAGLPKPGNRTRRRWPAGSLSAGDGSVGDGRDDVTVERFELYAPLPSPHVARVGDVGARACANLIAVALGSACRCSTRRSATGPTLPIALSAVEQILGRARGRHDHLHGHRVLGRVRGRADPDLVLLAAPGRPPAARSA